MKIIYFTTVTFCMMIASCKSDKEEKNEIGKYLYVANDGVLHTRNKCVGMMLSNNEEGLKANGMLFVDTLTIERNMYKSYCTYCFDDEVYERVQTILIKNGIKRLEEEAEAEAAAAAAAAGIDLYDNPE